MKSVLLVLMVVLLFTVCVVVTRKATRENPRPIAPQSQATAPRLPSKIVPAPGLPKRVHIEGPVKNRRILAMPLPEYPDWAERAGMSGDVSAKIWVHPDGRVRSFIQVTQMSGQQDFDDFAVDALRQWQFAEIPYAIGDQWGVVTFHFVLEYPKPQAPIEVAWNWVQ